MPRAPNSKAVAARERQQLQQQQKDAEKQRQEEQRLARDWAQGAKDTQRQEEEREKRQQQLARKQAAAELLAQEEAELSQGKGANKNAPKKKSGADGAPKKVPAFLLAGLRGADKAAAKKQQRHEEVADASAPVEEFTASNLDDALALLDLTSGGGGAVKPGKVGGSVAGAGGVGGATAIDRHPERRVKAAFAAYEEKWMPLLKAENPGLRHTQLKEILRKQWQKAEENPMNQQYVAYNASQEEIQAVAQQAKDELADRLRKK